MTKMSGETDEKAKRSGALAMSMKGNAPMKRTEYNGTTKNANQTHSNAPISLCPHGQTNIKKEIVF